MMSVDYDEYDDERERTREMSRLRKMIAKIERAR